MKPDAFARLQAAYEQRLPPPEGGVCVGCVGNTVPVELITACGARALRIAPVEGSTAAADRHVEAFSDRDARLIFAAFVEGRYDALPLLVVPRSSETWHKLYLALREARRTGLKAGGPALWLHDVPHTQRDSSRQYGLARTRELLDQVARLTGRRSDEAAWRQAISDSNAVRRQLQQLQAWRHEGRLSGWQAQVATGATHFMPSAEAQAALADAMQAAPPVRSPRPRLFVQGVPLDHPGLHALVDAAGGVVVQEDDDWGSRAAGPLIDEQAPPLEAVFDHYWRDVPCLRIQPAPAGRSAFVPGWQQGRIDGLLFNLPRPDDLHGWRLPAQRAEAQALGLPCLVLRDDAREAATRPALQQALSAFIEPLRRP